MTPAVARHQRNVLALAPPVLACLAVEADRACAALRVPGSLYCAAHRPVPAARESTGTRAAVDAGMAAEYAATRHLDLYCQQCAAESVERYPRHVECWHAGRGRVVEYADGKAARVRSVRGWR